jgi:hypothetical protein
MKICLAIKTIMLFAQRAPVLRFVSFFIINERIVAVGRGAPRHIGLSAKNLFETVVLVLLQFIRVKKVHHIPHCNLHLAA